MSDLMLQTWVTVQTWVAAAKSAVVRDEEGQGLVEYALILGLVAAVAIAILLTMGTQVSNIFSNIQEKLNSAQPS
jgi:pilus assembly protein Flp/PilA